MFLKRYIHILLLWPFTGTQAQEASVFPLRPDVPIDLPSRLVEVQSFARLNDVNEALKYCKESYSESLPADASWIISSVKESPAGVHYSFSASYQKTKIHGISLRIHCRPDGSIQYIQEQLPSPGLEIEPYQVMSDFLIHDEQLIHGSFREMTIMGIPHRMFEDSKGHLYDLGQVKLYFNQQDTPIYLYVFHPNPIVSKQAAYGDMYSDMGDADNDSLTASRELKMTRGSFLNGQFLLRNGYLRLGQVSDPVRAETTSATDTFDFTRSQDAFEQVNAFYHLNEYSDYIRNLGFSSLLDSIIIDAHAFNGGDLSAFDPSVYPYTLEFGEGGVDDAEDAQVVIHEFGHSLSTIAAPGTVNGSQRRAMEEGNADYFCMSHSRSISEYAWEEVFSWDGHNEFWNGFSVKSEKKYPADLRGNSDNDREIWSTALMCIWEQLGRSRADSLILNHLFYQAANASMPQMAQIILNLNRDLFQNDKHWAIQNCFAERGILDWSNTDQVSEQINLPFILLNSEGFAQHTSALRISLVHPLHWKYALLDMQGRIVQTSQGFGDATYLESTALKSGVYLLRLHINGKDFSTKLISY